MRSVKVAARVGTVKVLLHHFECVHSSKGDI